QCDATMHALIAENLSVDVIELEKLDAWHARYLMYYYELFTSTCGVMLGINTYDQPGVDHKC
ncbi:glucose-6-phosphate isomerase, partial [Campylobacter jejuni]|nr:glucose-6-phosphate isomerase [Campylobacter jejuni]MCG4168051.1 glucose-6-phosphate isomerase [Campylobacter jejuni]